MNDFFLNIDNHIVNFDNIEGNGINTYSKYLSNLTGGLYSKRSTLYYKDFPEDLRSECLQIGNNIKDKIERIIDKKLYWGESDFKVVLLRYEGESASFAWHYDTEPSNCFRTLTLIKGKGIIPPFCYKDNNCDTKKIYLSLGDTIYFKGTQTYHMVENSNDPNTIRWMLGFQFCDSEYDVTSKTICSELRGANLIYILKTFLPLLIPTNIILHFVDWGQVYVSVKYYIILNLSLLFFHFNNDNIDVKTFFIYYVYLLVYLDPVNALSYMNYILITE
jgi:hypothetical protein